MLQIHTKGYFGNQLNMKVTYGTSHTQQNIQALSLVSLVSPKHFVGIGIPISWMVQ